MDDDEEIDPLKDLLENDTDFGGGFDEEQKNMMSEISSPYPETEPYIAFLFASPIFLENRVGSRDELIEFP